MNSVQYCDHLIKQFNKRWVSHHDNYILICIWIHGYSNIAQTMVTMSRLNKEPEKLEEQMKNHNLQIQSVSV